MTVAAEAPELTNREVIARVGRTYLAPRRYKLLATLGCAAVGCGPERASHDEDEQGEQDEERAEAEGAALGRLALQLSCSIDQCGLRKGCPSRLIQFV